MKKELITQYFIENLSEDGEISGGFRLITSARLNQDSTVTVTATENTFTLYESQKLAKMFDEMGIEPPIKKLDNKVD